MTEETETPTPAERRERMERDIRAMAVANWSLKREIGRTFILAAQVAVSAIIAVAFFWFTVPVSSFLEGGWHVAFAALFSFGIFCTALNGFNPALPHLRRPKK